MTGAHGGTPRPVGWSGSVRNRLLFATLAETGMRLGECLSTRHCDWHAGRGGHPVRRGGSPPGPSGGAAGARAAATGGSTSAMSWNACTASTSGSCATRARTGRWIWTDHFVFVNLHRGQWLAPLRPETVYDLVAALNALGQPVRRRLDAALVPAYPCLGPAAVGRPGACGDAPARARGHPDHAEPLRLGDRGRGTAALADWRCFCAGWRGWEDRR